MPAIAAGSMKLNLQRVAPPCLVADLGTITVTEIGVTWTVRCIVNGNTAVQLYRDESLQP